MAISPRIGTIHIQINQPKGESVKGPKFNITIHAQVAWVSDSIPRRDSRNEFSEPSLPLPDSSSVEEVTVAVDFVELTRKKSIKGEFTVEYEAKTPGVKTITVTGEDFNRDGLRIQKVVKKKLNVLDWGLPSSKITKVYELKDVSSGEKLVEITGMTTDVHSTIASVSYRINKGEFIYFEKNQPVNSKEWHWKAVSKGVNEGENIITIRAVDSVGNPNDFEEIFIYGPPKTIVEFPASTSEINRFDKISWLGEGKTRLQIKGKTTDDYSKVTSIRWRFLRSDSEMKDVFRDIPINASKSIDWEFDALIPEPKNHTIEIIAQDDALNEETTLVYIGVRN